MSEVMTIGIAGGTGSGKTTLLKRIVKQFSGDISVVYYDNYYKAHYELPYEERAKLNYDHPDAFDTDLVIDHINKLKSGQSVQCPVYDYKIHNRGTETVEIKPSKVIIVEGILVFHDPRLRDLMDIKIFVDTDADVRILRRIMRDVQQRGRNLESVVNQYLTTVKPMHEQFVEPTKRYADIIVLDGGYNLVALDMIMQRIQNHVEKPEFVNEEAD
ncbi:MAG: uridine kinase [Clostridiales bacterium]|nr:uridine kinase [Clostridiales bacterium]